MRSEALIRRYGSIAFAVLLIIVSMILWQQIPSRTESYLPIPVRGALGERIVGRGIALTIHQVYGAHRISITRSDISTSEVEATQGYWIVVDLTYETILERSSGLVAHIRAGKKITEAIPMPLGPSEFDPGLPERIPVVFEISEIPTSLIFYGANRSDFGFGEDSGGPLDSQVEVPIPISSVHRMQVVSIVGTKVIE